MTKITIEAVLPMDFIEYSDISVHTTFMEVHLLILSYLSHIAPNCEIKLIKKVSHKTYNINKQAVGKLCYTICGRLLLYTYEHINHIPRSLSSLLHTSRET